MVALSGSAKSSTAKNPATLRLNVLSCSRVDATWPALWQCAGTVLTQMAELQATQVLTP